MMVRLSTCAALSKNTRQEEHVLATGAFPMKLHMIMIDHALAPANRGEIFTRGKPAQGGASRRRCRY